jgi:hypothetical protein
MFALSYPPCPFVGGDLVVAAIVVFDDLPELAPLYGCHLPGLQASRRRGLIDNGLEITRSGASVNYTLSGAAIPIELDLVFCPYSWIERLLCHFGSPFCFICGG